MSIKNICLPEKIMLLSTTPLDSFIQRFVFPVQFVLGVVGNVLIFSVLFSGTARNRANDLLSAMALADAAVLLFLLPHSLSAFHAFAFNNTFRYFYLNTKPHLAAMANWFSAAAIWFVLGVSIERLLIIKSPLRSRLYYVRLRMAGPVVAVFVATAALTGYHHVAHDCFLYRLCNDTQLYSQCFPSAFDWPLNRTNPHSHSFRLFVRTSTVINALFVVVIPIVIVALLNIALIRLLKKRSNQPLIKGSFRRSSDVAVQQNQERRVTITVCAVVSSFTLTQGPSAVIFMYELIQGKDRPGLTFYNITCLTNTLVITGKMLNVVLFCMTSGNFRRRLVAMVTNRLVKFGLVTGDTMRHKGSTSTHRTSLTATTPLHTRSFPMRPRGGSESYSNASSEKRRKFSRANTGEVYL